MALNLSLKDPVTGQYNWPIIIGGGGILVVGGILLLNRSSSSTGSQVSSPGQSSGITDQLSALQDAIAGLAGGGGGGGSDGAGGNGGGGTGSNGGGVGTSPLAFGSVPQSMIDWSMQQMAPQSYLPSGQPQWRIPSNPELLQQQQQDALAQIASDEATRVATINARNAAYASSQTSPNQPDTSPSAQAPALSGVILPSITPQPSNVSATVGSVPRQNPTNPVSGGYTGRLGQGPTIMEKPASRIVAQTKLQSEQPKVGAIRSQGPKMS